MPRKKTDVELEAPSAGELDVLGVLFAERQREDRPLQLSEVHGRVCQRREEFGEAKPALTTVSTHLRNLVSKNLIEEVTREGATPTRGNAPRTRGGMTPPTRSPLTSYRALHEPGAVLSSTFRGLAAAYPDKDRLRMLIDVAQSLDVADEVFKQIEAIVLAEIARLAKES